MNDGGILSKSVHSFSLFNTVEQNDAFLALVNHADGSDGSFPVGDGLCENLRYYSRVTLEERAGTEDPPCLNDEDYAKCLRWGKAKRDSMATTLTWKDDYLAFCSYVRAGTTQQFAATLVGILEGRMSDIFHEWTQILEDALFDEVRSTS